MRGADNCAAIGGARPAPSRQGRFAKVGTCFVSAINAGIEQRLFGLSPGEGWWPGAAPDGDRGERGLFRFAFDGVLDAVASVAAISGDELFFHVVLNPRRPEMVPDHFRGLTDADAYARCWLERRLGAWVQDGGEDFSCRRAVLARVAGGAIAPNG